MPTFEWPVDNYSLPMTRQAPSRAAALLVQMIVAGATRLYSTRLPYQLEPVIDSVDGLSAEERAFITREIWRSDLSARAYRSFLERDPPQLNDLMRYSRVRPSVQLERSELDALIGCRLFGSLAEISRRDTPGKSDGFLTWCLKSFTIEALRSWLVDMLDGGLEPPAHAREIAQVYVQRAKECDELEEGQEHDEAIIALASN